MTLEPVTRIKSKQPVPYELTAIHQDTHDTKTFCFALPDDATLDMLPGDHLYVHATIDGKAVKRPYTPSSTPGITGYFDLTVKRYETGMMSRYLHDRKVGDQVMVSGPNPGGHWVDGMAKKVGFVAKFDFTMRYGWIVYALSIPAAAASILLLLSDKSWPLWLGGFIYLIWATYGYTVEYVRRIQWRNPIRWSVFGPYVTLYLATVMFYWWPLGLLSKPIWYVYAALFIICTVLNVTSHREPQEA